MLSQQFTLSATCTTRFNHEISLVFYTKNRILGNFVEMLLRLFCDITVCYRNLWVRKNILENRVKSCYFTLPLLQTVDALSQQLDIPREPIVHRLLLQSIVGSSPKKRYEQHVRGIARGKRKRRGAQMWTGERSPFSPSP